MPGEEYMLALGHIPVDEEQQANHVFKKKGLWSGIKQIFHNKPRNRTPRRQGSNDLQSLSYSCLGNPRRRQEEEDAYRSALRNEENVRRLSRNLSLSHESVFQMDPHLNQVEDHRASMVVPPSRTYSSTALTSAAHRPPPPGYITTPPTAVPRPPMALQSELAMVLRERQYKDKEVSKRSLDLTDDEDLGLPKSLQNSPGDFSDEGRNKNWSGSRHHSSCSDNSIFSLDSFDTRLERDRSPPRKDGELSHSAARHKIAVRPRRNHAGRPRRMQQVREEEPQEDVQGASPAEIDVLPTPINSDDDSLQDMKNRSKSLDMTFRENAPNSAALSYLADEEEKKAKNKPEPEMSFLSRLFGSKRSKGKSSAVVVVGGRCDEEKPVRGKAPAPPSSHPPHLDLTVTTATEPMKSITLNQQSTVSTTTDKRASPVKSKPFVKARAPPPPPNYSPPPSQHRKPELSPNQTNKSVSKSKSFRGIDSTYGDLDYPSLPVHHVPNNDIILKKNKSMSSVLDNESSRYKFHSSIENWSYANEGLKRSIYSLADQTMPTTSHSNESLKTITSLLEEPDVLVQTRVSDCAHQSVAPAPADPDKDTVVPDADCFQNQPKVNNYYDIIFDKSAVITETRGSLDRQQQQHKEQSAVKYADIRGDDVLKSFHQPGEGVMCMMKEDDFDTSDLSLLSIDGGPPLSDIYNARSYGSVLDELQEQHDQAGFTKPQVPGAVPQHSLYGHVEAKEHSLYGQVKVQEQHVTSHVGVLEHSLNGDLGVEEESSDYFPERKTTGSPDDQSADETAESNETSVADDTSEQSSECLQLSKEMLSSDEMSSEASAVATQEPGQDQPTDLGSSRPRLTREIDGRESEPRQTSPPPLHLGSPSERQAEVSRTPPTRSPDLSPEPSVGDSEASLLTDQTLDTSDLDLSGPASADSDIQTRNSPTDLKELNSPPQERQSAHKRQLLMSSGGAELAEETCDKQFSKHIDEICINGDTAKPLDDKETKAFPANIETNRESENKSHAKPGQDRVEQTEETAKDLDSKLDIGSTPTESPEFWLCNGKSTPGGEEGLMGGIKSEAEVRDTNKKPLPQENAAIMREDSDNMIDESSRVHVEQSNLRSRPVLERDDNQKTDRELYPELGEGITEVSKVGSENVEDASTNPESTQPDNIKETVRETDEKIPRNDESSGLKITGPKKPQISPKPVPAPRHFFLKPSGLEEVCKDNELENVFARRSKSIRNLKEAREEEEPCENGGSNFSRSKSARNLGEMLKSSDEVKENEAVEVNVKERAKSFCGSQNLHLAPQPFRPVSIAADVRLSKPVVIPPKPKVAIKPVPAPRLFKSTSKLEGVNPKPILNPASRSATELIGSSFAKEESAAKPPPVSGSTPHVGKSEEIREIKDTTKPDQTGVQTSNKPQPLRELDNCDEILDEIHVKKIMNNFQKSAMLIKPSEPIKPPPTMMTKSATQSENSPKCPEKPVRRSRDKSVERTPVESNSNVMSIVSRLNAMSM